MKFKVVYIVHDTNSFAGATKSLLSLIERLSSHGVEAIAVLPDKRGVYKEFQRRQIKTVCVPMRLDVYPWTRSLTDILLFPLRLIYWQYLNHRALSKLYKLFKDDNISLVHTNVSVMQTGLKLAEKLHVPHVMHFREYGYADFGYHYFPSKKIYTKRLLSKQSYAIGITKDILRSHELTDYSRSQVIYNGIVDHTIPTIGHNNHTYILYAGRITAGKGLMHLVKAYCHYAESTDSQHLLPLHVAGEDQDTSYTESIKAYLRQHGQESNVVFLGQRNDVHKLMSEAVATVIPSENEGFGRCMVEAMSCGCLCVGHDTGGTHEQLENGLALTGREIALRYNSEAELSSLLSHISMADADAFDSMRRDALYTVGELYSVEKSANKVLELYKKITETTIV